jgi:hypothetical protein
LKKQPAFTIILGIATMPFTRELWQEQISAKLRHLGGWLAQRRHTDLPYLAYGAVAGLTLWPLVEAFVRSGRPDTVLPASSPSLQKSVPGL